MAVSQEELDSFHRFVSQQIGNGGAELTLEELLDLWRAANPTPEDLRDDVLAVKAAIRDLESGETGRPFEEFAEEFRRRNNISRGA